MGIKNKPPVVAKFILNFLLNHSHPETILADFEEVYHQLAEEKGFLYAKLWYWFQILTTIPSFFRNSIYWPFIMFSNYLKISWRNLLKQKLYSIINIAGLAFSMACCILILVWVQDELSYDRFHENSEQLFRVESNEMFSGEKFHTHASPVPLAPALLLNIPEVQYASRCTRFGGIHIRNNDKIYYENNIRAVDSDFFKMFSFRLIDGDINNALNDPFSIVLTEKMVEKYFGNENPLGKILIIENKYELLVTGVIEDIPGNSTVQFDMLVNFIFVRDDLERMPQGWGNAVSTFAQLRANNNINEVEQKITDLVHEHAKEGKANYLLNPITNMHLYYIYGRDSSLGLIRYVYIFSSVAIVVLIIACINFMNLSTARSSTRAKEIGMRKVVGAHKKNIVYQFLSESFFLSILALIFAVTLVLFLLPVFNSLTGKELSVETMLNGPVIFGLAGLTLLTGLISGSYPALFLSRFKPVKILGGLKNQAGSRASLRKTLVIIQFSLSIFLIIGTTVVYSQLDYMKNKDIGFDKDHLVCIRMTGETPVSYETLKSELKKIPEIVNITASGRRPSWISDTGRDLNWDEKDPDQHVKVIFHTVDFEYTKTLNIDIVDGRRFSKEITSDKTEAFIVNEELAKRIGGETVIGKNFQIFWLKGKIIGVTKNFHHLPLNQGIEPVVLVMAPNPYWLGNLIVKMDPQNINSTIESIEKNMETDRTGLPF